MKPKHTPGPWTVDKYNQIIKTKRSGAGIEKLDTAICRMIADEREGQNPEANANLISSAPDLLDMLTVCLGYIEADDDHDPKFANQIKAVIKKARGET